MQVQGFRESDQSPFETQSDQMATDVSGVR